MWNPPLAAASEPGWFEPMSDEKLPKSVHNWVSLAGAVVAVVSGAIILFLLAINFLESITNPYLGILLYLVLPLALAAGLLMITLGMYARWRSLQKRGEVVRLKWPSIDLNKPRHRNASLVFLLGTLAFVLMSTVGIYQAYQFSDSVTFCGTTCHTIMKPEYTTYQHSPHARVKCVACHIGPGAGWYVRSKLSGLYQVYATIANIYPRPLPNPIKHLRPLQRECLSCHWPSKFFGTMERHFDHYLYDKSNTPWSIVMLLRVGGGGPSVGRRQGIHWHTSPEIRVEYIATDRLRQNIPWVRVTDLRTGKSIVYREAGAKPSTEVAWAQAGRVMDCIDCHNHPSHIFHSPDFEVDMAISNGGIDRGIPEIKRVAVGAMEKKYPSAEEAAGSIENDITGFYRKDYPEFSSKHHPLIANAVKAVQAAFANSVFPAMKARWTTYPDNSEHFTSRGCMRCHDGRHRSLDGATIPNDCRTCHVILQQGSGRHLEQASDFDKGLDFRHPVDIAGLWKGGVCYECHSGTKP
jgi:hypothetical protein